MPEMLKGYRHRRLNFALYYLPWYKKNTNHLDLPPLIQKHTKNCSEFQGVLICQSSD